MRFDPDATGCLSRNASFSPAVMASEATPSSPAEIVGLPERGVQAEPLDRRASLAMTGLLSFFRILRLQWL